ncbi:hypothetical protein BH24CHL9_BH24CHL9_13770 [soil metagenome]
MGSRRSSGGARSSPARRAAIVASIVAVLIAAPGAWVAQGQDDGSPLPTGDRPLLADPIPAPDGPPPPVDADGPPTVSVKRKGVRLDLWVPAEPLESGAWVPALLRVTNVGKTPILVYGYPDAMLCGNPTASGIDLTGLWDPGVGWEGNAAVFKAAFLARAPGRLGMGAATDDEGGLCLDVGLPAGRMPAGASFEMPLATWLRYLWRDQPLPAGTAEVASRFTFTRPSRKPGLRRATIEVRAPITVAGVDVSYPSPQAIVDAALAQPEFYEWIGTRRFDEEWSPSGHGIEAPEDSSFAEIDPQGGPAPEDTVEIGAFAEGSAPGNWGRVTIDPWDGSVEEVEITG